MMKSIWGGAEAVGSQSNSWPIAKTALGLRFAFGASSVKISVMYMYMHTYKITSIAHNCTMLQKLHMYFYLSEHLNFTFDCEYHWVKCTLDTNIWVVHYLNWSLFMTALTVHCTTFLVMANNQLRINRKKPESYHQLPRLTLLPVSPLDKLPKRLGRWVEVMQRGLCILLQWLRSGSQRRLFSIVGLIVSWWLTVTEKKNFISCIYIHGQNLRVCRRKGLHYYVYCIRKDSRDVY